MQISAIREREGFLEIRLDGEYSMEDLPAVFKAVTQAVERPGGSHLLLISTEVTGRAPSTLERYDLSMAMLALPKGIRIAMLPRRDMIDAERFGQTVAQNRGLPFEVFTVEGAAVDWLLERKGKPSAG